MFIGHFAVGFALKRAAPRTSLGVLIAAPQLPDLLWPWFLLLGWERVRIDPGNTAVTPLAFDSYPISHSLLMSVVWGVALAILYVWRGKANGSAAGAIYRRRVAIWLAIAVVSHWVLDGITHRPDMPITPWGDTKLGLGLWYSVPGTVAVESLMYAAGVWLYARTTRARDRLGTINFWIYVVVLAAIYVANLAGPPPPDPRSLAIVALGAWLFPLWAAWFDRHRAPQSAT